MIFQWCMIVSENDHAFLVVHDLFGKPVSTFPDHGF